MKAVILAGGLGTRLKPFTEVIPKPLLPIGEKSLLEIQIQRLKAHGVEDVFLATNYKSAYIKNFLGDGSALGVRIHISEEPEPLGTAGPLSLLRDELTDPFIMMNGDILTTMDFRKFREFSMGVESDLCLAIKNIITPFDFGKISYEGDFVTDVEEKPDIEMEILAGIYLIKPGLLELIPDNTYFGMDTLIKQMLAGKKPVAKYSMQEYWLDIGQLKNYELAQNAYEEHFKED